MTVLAFSELLWFVYHLSGQPAPYPSAVDISWGIGFVPVLASLVVQYRALKVQLGRRRKLLILAAYLGVLLTIAALSLGYVLSHPGEVAVTAERRPSCMPRATANSHPIAGLSPW